MLLEIGCLWPFDKGTGIYQMFQSISQGNYIMHANEENTGRSKVSSGTLTEVIVTNHSSAIVKLGNRISDKYKA